ncbi:MAG: DUF167 domain-containing protein [Fimbriimonadales bacterium]
MVFSELAKKLRTEKELRLRVKVVPGSSRSEAVGYMADGTLKIRIQAPPEKGKANAELRSLLAKALDISPCNVEIVSGESSPLKRLRISL